MGQVVYIDKKKKKNKYCPHATHSTRSCHIYDSLYAALHPREEASQYYYQVSQDKEWTKPLAIDPLAMMTIA